MGGPKDDMGLADIARAPAEAGLAAPEAEQMAGDTGGAGGEALDSEHAREDSVVGDESWQEENCLDKKTDSTEGTCEIQGTGNKN